MKKVYDKPFAQKVEFSYENQIVVASNNFVGDVSNPDNSGKCQQLSSSCNILWKASYGTSTYNLDTCWVNPFMGSSCSET